MKKPYDVGLELYFDAVKATDITYIVGDKNTMPLTIRLLENRREFELPEFYEVELSFENSQGTRFPRIAEHDETGLILYQIQPEDIAIRGKVTVSVSVNTGTEILTWTGFSYAVLPSLSDGQTVPPDYYLPWTQGVNNSIAGFDTRLSDIEAHGGVKGDDGDSAYQVAVNNGYVGTETQWLASLKGADGAPGATGATGAKGDKGDPGTPADMTRVEALEGIAADHEERIDALEQGSGTSGVASFNGRSGAVMPQAGDYTVAMVTGAASETALNQAVSSLGGDISSVSGALNSHTANTGNPHGVTTAQIGAATSAQMSAANASITALQNAGYATETYVTEAINTALGGTADAILAIVGGV